MVPINKLIAWVFDVGLGFVSASCSREASESALIGAEGANGRDLDG